MLGLGAEAGRRPGRLDGVGSLDRWISGGARTRSLAFAKSVKLALSLHSAVCFADKAKSGGEVRGSAGRALHELAGGRVVLALGRIARARAKRKRCLNSVFEP